MHICEPVERWIEKVLHEADRVFELEKMDHS